MKSLGLKYDSMPISVSERKSMKNKKIIGLTLLSALLISGCTNAYDGTTPIKDSTNTTIRDSTNTPVKDSTNIPIKDSTNTSTNTESVESENYQYYPLSDGTLSIAVGTNRDLQYLTIPETHHGKMVTQIADNGFANCTALKQINLPDSINVIGEKAFLGCSSLNSINISDGTSVIGNYAFEGCSSLSEVTIPTGITELGKYAFKDCTGIKNILLPSGITIINDGTFKNCSSLTIVVIPNSIVTIGESTFEGCSSLTSVVIPGSVTSIGYAAFYGCSSLTSVTIPDSVTSIGGYAFEGCSSLTIYCVAEKQPEGWNCDWNTTYLSGFDRARTEWGCEGGGTYLDLVYRIDIINGERVATIVNYIGTESKLMIPGVIEGTKVVGIGNSAFSRCKSLTSVTIPDSVTSIGEYAFYGCSSLTSVTIPDSVTSIGEYAFIRCSSLTIYCVAEAKPEGWSYSWNSSYRPVVWGCVGYGASDSFLYGISKINNDTYAVITGYRGSDTDIRIPETINGVKVAAISEYAFYRCSSLTSVVIPDSVTSIGKYAFDGWSSLTIYCVAEAKPEGWDDNWIGFYSARTEWGCEGGGTYLGLAYRIDIINGERVATIVNYIGTESKLMIPGVIEGTKVVGIGNSAFSRCKSLTSVTIPDSVTSIGGYAFDGCTSLTICCEAEKQPEGWSYYWNSSYRPVVWGCVGYGASDSFLYGISKINNDTYAVITGYRGSDTDIRIPETINGVKVAAISEYAFYRCSSLTSVVIPDSVTSIGKYAFDGWSSLTIYCVAEAKPEGWDDNWIGFYSARTEWGCEGGGTYLGLAYRIDIINGERVATIVNYIGTESKLMIPGVIEGTKVVGIGNGAFEGCSSLTSVVIPNSVTSIGDGAFRDCSSLTICCEAEKQPVGWNDDWNPSNRPVVWGYKSKP